jgi:hypothetical protein
MLPVLLGVMACFNLPAPIGNPEKSRIDPAMSGIWANGFDLEDDSGWIWILEPYDRRTWLVSWLFVEMSEPVDRGELDEENGLADLNYMLHIDRLKTDLIAFNKAWLTDIKGHRFLVFEPRVQVSSGEPLSPESWWTMRVRSVDEDVMMIDFVDPDYDGFSEALARFDESLTRAQVGKLIERVIRKHIDDPELFLEEKFAGRFRRFAVEDYVLVARLLKRAEISTKVD